MNLVFSRRFEEDYKKLLRAGEKYRNKVLKTLEILAENIEHPSLRLHKLNNRHSYSVSVDMKIRILMEIEDDMIFLIRIGNHDEVYRD